jgi:acyl-CoA synthetase (AMP-forming)/AMP-acid ligase II
MEMQSIADVLRRAEKLFGSKGVAVDGERHYTYAEIAERCRRLASGLRSLGVDRGDRVATLMANGHRYLEAYFAVPGSGSVLVPLNNRHAIPEHQYVLDDAGAEVLIVDAAHTAVGEQLKAPSRTVLVAPDEYEALLGRSEPAPLTGPRDENDIAGLFYTGGTPDGPRA